MIPPVPDYDEMLNNLETRIVEFLNSDLLGTQLAQRVFHRFKKEKGIKNGPLNEEERNFVGTTLENLEFKLHKGVTNTQFYMEV